MPHKVHPKLLENWLKSGTACTLSETCELKGVTQGDISPCSHFDYCKRPATIWIYEPGAHWVYGFCNACYNWCYPAPRQWYRVVKVSDDFKGVL